MFKIFIFTKLLIFAVIMISGFSQAAFAIQLLPHRAVYDLRLKNAASHSGIKGVEGRIVYEFRGSQCDGYTVNYRFVSKIFLDKTTRLSDQQTSTYENGDANSFRFMSRSYINQELKRETHGMAKSRNDQLLIDLKKPGQREFNLPKSAFPTAHLIELIEKAKAGENIYQSRIFDGSDGGEKALTTLSIIGHIKDGFDKDNGEVNIIGDSGKAAVWPVSLSYFDALKPGDILPVYRVSFKLYENGVSRELVMDYGDFVVEGKITSFDVLAKEKACK